MKPQAQHHYTIEKQASSLIDIGLGNEGPDKGYLARLMFHTMLPHSPQQAREWSRKNGNRTLYMQAGPRTDLPYGCYPRLIFAWIVTEAKRTKSPTLRLGESLSKFMAALGLLPTGGRWGSITQLKEQMQRLLSARLAAYVDDEQGRGEQAMMVQVGVRWDLWWHPHEPEQAALWESTLELSQEFFQEITAGAYPVDLRILRAVKRSPLGIDLYTWLTHRISYMHQTTAISWESLHGQLGAEYADTKNGRDDFVKAAKRELKKIKVAWPEFVYTTPRGRLLLYPSDPSVKFIES